MRRTHATLLTPTIALLTLACSGDPIPSEQRAAARCKEAVLELLSAPSTARFSNDRDTAITTLTQDPWQYQVEGHVDSANPFGDRIRTSYVCTISTTDGDEWTLDDLQVTDHV